MCFFTLENLMSKSLHHQVVTRAREIITDPHHWIRGAFAIAKDYSPIDPTDERAYRFCAVGALRRAAHEIARGEQRLADHVELALEDFIHRHHPEFDDDLERLNDVNDGHANVLKVFDEFVGVV
jgi:hypothetical protein